jgi:hypothetical protein
MTPQVIDVTDKVEGALNVNGLTQVSIDSGYRRTVVDGKPLDKYPVAVQ